MVSYDGHSSVHIPIRFNVANGCAEMKSSYAFYSHRRNDRSCFEAHQMMAAGDDFSLIIYDLASPGAEMS